MLLTPPPPAGWSLGSVLSLQQRRQSPTIEPSGWIVMTRLVLRFGRAAFVKPGNGATASSSGLSMATGADHGPAGPFAVTMKLCCCSGSSAFREELDTIAPVLSHTASYDDVGALVRDVRHHPLACRRPRHRGIVRPHGHSDVRHLEATVGRIGYSVHNARVPASISSFPVSDLRNASAEKKTAVY